MILNNFMFLEIGRLHKCILKREEFLNIRT